MFLEGDDLIELFFLRRLDGFCIFVINDINVSGCIGVFLRGIVHCFVLTGCLSIVECVMVIKIQKNNICKHDK